MYCNNCGEQASQSDEFCTNCGKELNENRRESDQKRISEKVSPSFVEEITDILLRNTPVNANFYYLCSKYFILSVIFLTLGALFPPIVLLSVPLGIMSIHFMWRDMHTRDVNMRTNLWVVVSLLTAIFSLFTLHHFVLLLYLLLRRGRDPDLSV